jgi:putative alpha-1,2-mannosidase
MRSYHDGILSQCRTIVLFNQCAFFKKTVIHQENGKIFVIKAHNLSDKNKYIVAALLNGVRYVNAFIEHADIVNGGELILEMGAVPSVNWGTKIVPPSKSDVGQ